MRASRGAITIAWSIMPGTPTASKITSGSDAVDTPPRVHRSLDRGIDDFVRTHLRGERSPRRREVGRHDRLDAAAAQVVDHREADRSAPQHDGGVARCDLRLHDRVDADRERLGERGVVDGLRPFGTFIATRSLRSMSSP